MSGAANFELTAEDYVGAQRGHGKRLSAWLALLFFVCAILFALVDSRIGVSPWSDWNLWLVVTIGLMFLAWEFIARDAIIRRQFRQSLPMPAFAAISHTTPFARWCPRFIVRCNGTTIVPQRRRSVVAPVAISGKSKVRTSVCVPLSACTETRS